MDPFKGSLIDPFKGSLIDPFKGTLIDPFKVQALSTRLRLMSLGMYAAISSAVRRGGPGGS